MFSYFASQPHKYHLELAAEIDLDNLFSTIRFVSLITVQTEIPLWRDMSLYISSIDRHNTDRHNTDRIDRHNTDSSPGPVDMSCRHVQY